jgi:sulfur carrier protein ThiS
MKKAAIKETFLTIEGFMKQLFQTRKKFAVMLNNNLYAFRIKKALHDDRLLLTQHCFITITYLNFL